MKTKTRVYRNGWSAYMEKTGATWRAWVRNPGGQIHDSTRCDDYRAALDYYRAFCLIARNAR